MYIFFLARTQVSCGGITVLTSTKKKVHRVLARKSLLRTNQKSPSVFSHQIRNNSKKDKTIMSQMMGWIENRPNKFLNQNFVPQGLPAKCKTQRFRFISLICGMINPESTTFGVLTPYPTFSSGMEIVTTLPRASRPLSLSDLYCQALKDARDC